MLNTTPKMKGTTIMFSPGSRVRNNRKRSSDSNGKSSGARKQTFTIDTNKIGTMHRITNRYSSYWNERKFPKLYPPQMPHNMPRTPDQVKVRLALFRQWLGVTSITRVLPIDISATPNKAPCNTRRATMVPIPEK